MTTTLKPNAENARRIILELHKRVKGVWPRTIPFTTDERDIERGITLLHALSNYTPLTPESIKAFIGSYVGELMNSNVPGGKLDRELNTVRKLAEHLPFFAAKHGYQDKPKKPEKTEEDQDAEYAASIPYPIPANAESSIDRQLRMLNQDEAFFDGHKNHPLEKVVYSILTVGIPSFAGYAMKRGLSDAEIENQVRESIAWKVKRFGDTRHYVIGRIWEASHLATPCSEQTDVVPLADWQDRFKDLWAEAGLSQPLPMTAFWQRRIDQHWKRTPHPASGSGRIVPRK